MSPRALIRCIAAPARFAPGPLVCVLSVLLVWPQPARAEYRTITAQARAAHAEWLPWAPLPPGGPAAVCLVDTGVDLNPDTQSNVIERIALDGGDGGNASPSNHGTYMAMAMGAPINDWGMVGAWPAVRIVSVRAADPGKDTFPFGNYSRAIRTCQKRAADRPIKVIELALGGDPGEASTPERQRLADYVLRARLDGLNVVAAAGNRGGTVEAPADFDPIVSVGANDSGGTRCSFSAVGADIDGPGCGLDGADAQDGEPTAGAQGTSQSSAFVAAILASLRSYRPDLSPDAAEHLLMTASSTQPSVRVDVERSFRAAGLSSIVDEAQRQMPQAPVAEAIVSPLGVGEALRGRRLARLPMPRIQIRMLRRHVKLRLLNRPRNAVVIITARRPSCDEFMTRALRRLVSRSTAVLPRGPWRSIEVRYRDGFAPDSPVARRNCWGSRACASKWEC